MRLLPHKGMKNKLSPATESISFSSLPYDMLLNILARVSRLYYPTLSLVSKQFRDIVASPELYQNRSVLGRTESCLYVCIYFPPHNNRRWFTLSRNPNPSLNKNGNGYLLVPISSPSSLAMSSVVAIGCDIYEIGGNTDDVPSSRVLVLDCMSNTWREAPRMEEGRSCPSACVVDGKIFVIGGGEKGGNFSGLIEMFDPKTQTWKPSPGKLNGTGEALAIDGKLYIYHRSMHMYYNPKDGTCKPEIFDFRDKFVWFGYCVVNNVLFIYENRVFKWYDTKVREWKTVQGLEGLRIFPRFTGRIKLAGYGGKMVVLWEEDVPYIKGASKIRCAEISLEKCNNDEAISGKVVWFDVVLQHLHTSCYIVGAIAATV